MPPPCCSWPFASRWLRSRWRLSSPAAIRPSPRSSVSMAAGAFAGLALVVRATSSRPPACATPQPQNPPSLLLCRLSRCLCSARSSIGVYPRLLKGIGVVLATAGLALLTLPESGLGVGLGDLLTVVCALSFAAHIVIVGHFSAKCSFQVMSLAQISTAALIAGGSFWWAEHPRVHWTPRLLIAILVTGLLATALGFAVQTWAQKHLSPTRTGLILSLEPVFAWVTLYLVAGESLSVKGVSGALLILSGILIAELKPPWLGRHPSQ